MLLLFKGLSFMIFFSVYGPALLEHTILSAGLKPTAKVPQQFDVNDSDGK